MLRKRMRARSQAREDGAVAIMVALCTLILVVIAAMVVDFGLVRLDRQINKSAADSAAMSGLEAMRHVDATGQETGKAAPYPAVCSALTYLRATQPELASLSGTLNDGLGAAVAGAACPLPAASPLQHVACNPDDRTTWAWYTGTADGGRLQVDIMNGYVPSEDADNFPEENLDTLVADQGAPQHKGCDQLAVIITETRTPSLGQVASDDDMTFSIRSVARVDMGDDNSEVVALVTLERKDCQALFTTGVTTKILVDGYTGTPGMMHSDSAGNGDRCTSKKVLSVDGNNVGAIVAGDSDDGKPGVIGIVALDGGAGAQPANATDPIPYVYTEPFPPGGAPQGHKLVSRSPADKDYRNGVQDEIVRAKLAWSSPAPTTTVPSTKCSGTNVPTAAALADTGTVYFDCPSGVDYSQDITLSAKTVIFKADLKVKSGKTFAMPNASKVYIRGAGSSGLDVQGIFRMHTGGAATCSTATASSRGRLVIGNGRINSSNTNGVFQACNTAVIMTGQATLTDGCVPDDSIIGLEPQMTTSCTSGYLDVTGGSTDWTAPNLVGAGRTQADLDDLEDLAFWTESENQSRIVGNGGITLKGVFVLPNANPFLVGGTGAQDVKDAQYFTRKLGAQGGGTLYMKPNPDNVTKVPYYGNFALVR